MNYYDMEQLSRIEPAYLAAYGLNNAPFSPRLDDRFYFQSNEISDHLQLIRHLVRFGNLMLMVIGENGVGKTSFKNHLLGHADENWYCCEIEAHTMMDGTQLLREIVRGFAISDPPIDQAALYTLLENQLQHLQEEGHNPVLAIDNAHELPKDSLEVLFHLSNFNTDTNPMIRILLFCEPQIEAMLDAPAISMFRERVTHKLHISRLSEEETAEYLRHRMAVAGLDGASPFTPRLVKKIYKASAGNPAKINEYAHMNLQDDSEPAFEEEQQQFEPANRFTPMRMIAGGAALALIVVVLLFQQQINTLFEDTPAPVVLEEQAPIASTPAQVQVQVVEKTIEFDVGKTDPPTGTPAAQEAVPAEQQNQADAVLTSQQNEKSTAPQPAAAEDSVTPALPQTTVKLLSIDPSIVDADNTSKTLVIKGEGLHENQQVLVTWTGNNKTLDSSQVVFDSDNQLSISLNPGRNTDTWTVTLHDPEHRLQSNTLSFSTKATDIATVRPFQPHDEGWIKQQKPDHFTLQLLGTYQDGIFEKYLRQHQLQGEAASFTTSRNGRPWYTLIYGQFDDRASAQKVMASLPAAVGKPWLRTFASIQPLLAKPATIITTSKPPAAVISSAMPSSDRLATHDAWLWSQHPGHYTLQVMAGKNLSAIQSFWQQHKLAGRAVYYKTRKDGYDRYVLLYGEYATRQQALDAVSQLPAALQNHRPWARPFSDIHSQLQSTTNP